VLFSLNFHRSFLLKKDLKKTLPITLQITKLKKAREYRERYQDLEEQYNDLRSSHLDAAESSKEKKNLYLQVRESRETNIQLQIDLDSQLEQVSDLKKRLKTSSNNVNRLNLALIELTKSKTAADKAMLKYEDEMEYLQKECELIAETLEANTFRLSKEAEFWKNQCQQTEQEKMEMQNEITNATLGLIEEHQNAINEQHRRVIRCIKCAAHGSYVGLHTSGRFIVRGQNDLDVVTSVGFQYFSISIYWQAFAPRRFNDVDVQTVALAHIDPTMREHAVAGC
jgi:hypothetical protein